MSQAVSLLDEALVLARQEKAALEHGEYEEAIEFAEQRSKITNMAWNEYDICDKAPYFQRLMQLSNIQKQLSSIALLAHDTIRDKLKTSKQEQKRLRGYHAAVGQALQ